MVQRNDKYFIDPLDYAQGDEKRVNIEIPTFIKKDSGMLEGSTFGVLQIAPSITDAFGYKSILNYGKLIWQSMINPYSLAELSYITNNEYYKFPKCLKN